MPSTPYYSITSCCDQSTTQGFFTIPGSLLVANGVYTYSGISFLEGTTGMWFYSGFCYTVEYAGTALGSVPPAFNSVDISPATGDTCSSSDCVACDGPAIPPSYSVYNCCDAAVIVNLNINITACSTLDGTWVYDGTGYSTDGGFVFTPGDCYNFSRIEEGVYENGPDCTEFTISAKSCVEAQADGDCPACELGLQYLAFRSCCGPTTLLFRGDNASSYYGIREYLGTLVNGLENICYSIVIGNVGDMAVPDLAAYNALPVPPTYIEGVTFSTISIFSTTCADFISSCPSCFPLPCYTLYNCAGESFNTTIDLSAYTNTWITITNYLGVVSGPWLVTETIGECIDAIDTIAFEDTTTPCPSVCYEATGEGEITYVNDTYNLVTVYSPLKFCSYIYPTVSPGIIVTTEGSCVDVGNGMECPSICFLLTNCEDPLITYNSNSQNLYNNVGQVVTINGYDGCWEVSINDGICDCPINATVLTSYTTCEECLPIIAYKLINCLNPAQVQYTYQDLSAYVGHGVELECGQCWVVEQIDYAPPSVQVITIAFDFENCRACARIYYKLDDCAGILPDAYTFTDLSEYIGSVIKLKDCDTCWTVTETRLLLSPASIVTFEQEHVDCVTCQSDAPCLCSTIRNDQAIATSFLYVDCLGVQQTTPSILSGETSDKVCLQRWLNNVDQTNYVKYYGDCIDGVCPPPVYHLRTVKPGYNTPACSAEKYEKISCKAAQILYRNVLTLRYGISNCCPEEDEYWLVKKELIDLAALYNPLYLCAPNNPCGCGCGSQGSCGSSCGCGQPNDCSCS